MKIGMLGSGNVGQALAKGFIAEGYVVFLATRDVEAKRAELEAAVPGATVCDFATCAKEAELAVLAVPWPAVEAAIQAAGAENLAGKVVIDANNRINRSGELPRYQFAEQSGAQQIQGWLPESKVVKAFNTVGANLMYKPDLSATPTMFIAGDDADAKQQVADIVAKFGWEPLDAGNLLATHEIEAAALVWIRNSIANGRDHAFKML